MGTLAVALRLVVEGHEGDHKGPHPTHHHPRPYGDEAASHVRLKKTYP